MAKSKILVMDDEEIIRTVASKMLEFLGYSVLVVKNGEEAISQYQKHQTEGFPFDGVILDWVVQNGMNGALTIAALLQIDPAVKCLLSSGMDPVEAIEKANALGFYGIISKPYDIKRLESAVRELLITPSKLAADPNPQ